MKKRIKMFLTFFGLLELSRTIKHTFFPLNDSFKLNFEKLILDKSLTIKFPKVNGEFEMDRRSHILQRILEFGEYENKTIEIIEEIGEIKGDIIDVGSNCGIFSILFSNIINEFYKVHAVDAHPRMIELLTRNIKRNKKKDAIISHNVGISSSKKTLDFYYIDGKEEYSSFKPIRHDSVLSEKQMSLKINVITLDDLVETEKLQPKLIKIDVEGLEYDVFLGMKKTLQQFKPIVVMEVSNNLNMNKNADIFNDFEQLGYRIIDIETGKKPRNALSGNILAKPK